MAASGRRHGLEGIVSKRTDSAYRSGPSCDWVKTKTTAWREANRERWRLRAIESLWVAARPQ
jgi:ATP-dependent DNA ligase